MNGSCVWVRPCAGGVDVTGDPSEESVAPFLHFETGAWGAFLEGARNGEFDAPPS